MAIRPSALPRAFMAGACACALAATANPAAAAEPPAAAKHHKSQINDEVAEKPLRGVIHWHGGYSYHHTDTLSSNGRFIDPSATRQSLSGPFDNGFFFDSGVGPRGGEAPYQH